MSFSYLYSNTISSRTRVMKKPLPVCGAAPSSLLLKFLRSQSKGIPFFTANSCFRCGALRGPQHMSDATHRFDVRRPAQRFMTAAAPNWPIEASMWPIECGSLRHARQDSCANSLSDAPNSPRHLTLNKLPQRLSQWVQLRRSASTSHGEPHRSFWGFSKRRPKYPVEPTDLPQLSSFLGDETSLGRPLRPANELRLRCTELDETGKVTLVNGEFKKSELIAKVTPS